MSRLAAKEVENYFMDYHKLGEKIARAYMVGITVGDTTLHEVKCVINSNLHAPALLGQDVLGKLGTIQLDYKGGKLKVIR